MRKLLVYLKDYKKESVLGPLFKLLEASFELFVPLVIARIVDTGIDGGDYGYVWRMGTAAMITRMTSDINQVQSGVNLVLRLFLRSPFIVFGAMIMAFTIDVKAAFIFVVTIPLLSIVVFGIMLISIPLYKKVQAG